MLKDLKRKECLVLDLPVKEWEDGSSLAQDSYECPKHGIVTNHITSNIKGFEGIWCQICSLEKLDALGVSRLTKIKS